MTDRIESDRNTILLLLEMAKTFAKEDNERSRFFFKHAQQKIEKFPQNKAVIIIRAAEIKQLYGETDSGPDIESILAEGVDDGISLFELFDVIKFLFNIDRQTESVRYCNTFIQRLETSDNKNDIALADTKGILADVYRVLAFSAIDSRDFTKAREYTSRAVESAIADYYAHHILYHVAQKMREKGRDKDAIEMLNRSLLFQKSGNRYFDSMMSLGQIATSQGENEKAIEKFTAAAAAAPEGRKDAALVSLAEITSNVDYYRQAVECVNEKGKALRLHELGSALAKMEQHKECASVYRKLVACSDNENLKGIAYYQIALSSLAMKEFDEAEQAFKSGMPLYAVQYRHSLAIGLANMYVQLGKLEEAETSFKQAIEIAVEQHKHAMFYLLADFYRTQKNQEKYCQALRDAISTSDDLHEKQRFYLGYLIVALGTSRHYDLAIQEAEQWYCKSQNKRHLLEDLQRITESIRANRDTERAANYIERYLELEMELAADGIEG